MWVVDTVDESSSLSSVRYLLPKLPSAPLCVEVKPPSHRMWGCGAALSDRSFGALRRLFGSCAKSLLDRVIDCSRGDLRQMCLKLWMFGDRWRDETPAITGNDPFWGVFHMIKKMLLGKRRSDGRLENDFDRMFVENRITVADTVDYLDANFPDYFGDIGDCAAILDDFCDVENMGYFRARSGKKAEKEGDDMQAVMERLRFHVLGLAPAVRNAHPTEQMKRFAAITSPRLGSLQNLRWVRRADAKKAWIRFREVMESRMGFEEFVELGPSLLSRIERSVFEELGWKEDAENGTTRLIDLDEFTKILHLVMDLNDVGVGKEGSGVDEDVRYTGNGR